jgi:hypothetical protein
VRTTRERERKCRPPAGGFEEELARARKVPEPWFRCQALAGVARHAPAGDVLRVANEAVKAAMLGSDAYRQVAVCAWPLRALLERGKVERAVRLAGELGEQSRKIEHPVSRVEALFLVVQAGWPLPPATRDVLVGVLVAACAAANSWKAGRAIGHIALMLAGEDPARAIQLATSMPESRYRRDTLRRLAVGEATAPRDFFHSGGAASAGGTGSV